MEHPDAQAIRPGNFCLDRSTGVAQIDRDFFINEGFEAFYELLPELLDGIFVVKDFQHCLFLALTRLDGSVKSPDAALKLHPSPCQARGRLSSAHGEL